MCGILGTNFLSDNFSNSLDLLNNRGPDYKNFIKIDNNEFGHTRLAIIDLNEEANQPMIFDDIVLVFNGEIYNYKELFHVNNLIVKLQVIVKLLLDFIKNMVLIF